MTLNSSHSTFTQLAADEQVERTVQALQTHGIHVVVCETGEEARAYVLACIPAGAEVYDAPSRTLETLGLTEQIARASRFQSVRTQLATLDLATERNKMRKLIAAPDLLLGSVQAITEQGEILLASASGSQLGAAVFGANKVIWVVSTQKLVHTLADGLRRIREYSLPLENERALQVYGQGSAINKLLTVKAEHEPDRITLVLVKQQIGF
ncbi:hypothetical protein KDA_74200 [Dictyobacter alpinus]|uniref:LUD domain-containing protein n=1 Tax=Dictyobacter alpinus TaxID=2014873 RepID=A0A402BKU0_9CHLR|nr:LUD domain-containing protein [Dictyobacter alpinus]GCE31936.1 hypothetical protein KDA_74200 [Dictyobacter alpinus]